ncbi:MAG: hypothetical protein WEC39_01470 [Patescibacteria group bacterium]
MSKGLSRKIPAMPNSFPFNELLLKGMLSAKTRNWRWSHSGLTLLYTSTSTASEVAKAYGLDPKLARRGVIVGAGELVSVRELSKKEARQIEQEFSNGSSKLAAVAGLYRYEFRNLKRFRKPIPFRPPRGAVRTFNVPLAVVADALEEVGMSPI